MISCLGGSVGVGEERGGAENPYEKHEVSSEKCENGRSEKPPKSVRSYLNSPKQKQNKTTIKQTFFS